MLRGSMAQRKKRKNVFVLGLDEVHAQNLRTIPDADRFRFHELLHADEIVYLEEYDIDAKLDEARRILDKADGTIDAVIGHWDFPVTSMVPILCREYSLISPTLTSVLTCTHKYWSRLEQQKAAPEATPKFCAVDPFDDRAPDRIELDYPFWIKPVKGYASILGFYIAGREDLDKALAQARQEIRRLGEPFTRFLERVERPREIHEVDGNHMIAEEIIGGRELARAGHRHGLGDQPSSLPRSAAGHPPALRSDPDLRNRERSRLRRACESRRPSP